MYQHNGSESFPQLHENQENIAYMRELATQDILRLMPAIDLPDEIKSCWVLFSSEGEPLAVASYQTDLINNAFYNDLMTVLPN